jgi:hypothetical protein
VILIDCPYEPPHTHEFPDDWEFGGANGLDPRTDRRWVNTKYRYLDDHFNVVWGTGVPLCEDQAIDEFTKHAELGAKYLQAKRPGSDEYELLDWQYDRATDTVSPLGV